ncbi:MAG: hypothetical protein ACKOWP_00060 [Microbacteriaceae bacterium]
MIQMGSSTGRTIELVHAGIAAVLTVPALLTVLIPLGAVPGTFVSQTVTAPTFSSVLSVAAALSSSLLVAVFPYVTSPRLPAVFHKSVAAGAVTAALWIAAGAARGFTGVSPTGVVIVSPHVDVLYGAIGFVATVVLGMVGGGTALLLSRQALRHTGTWVRQRRGPEITGRR